MNVSRQGEASAFSYHDLDATIARMASCNAFERSPVQFKLLTPGA